MKESFLSFFAFFFQSAQKPASPTLEGRRKNSCFPSESGLYPRVIQTTQNRRDSFFLSAQSRIFKAFSSFLSKRPLSSDVKLIQHMHFNVLKSNSFYLCQCIYFLLSFITPRKKVQFLSLSFSVKKHFYLFLSLSLSLRRNLQKGITNLHGMNDFYSLTITRRFSGKNFL